MRRRQIIYRIQDLPFEQKILVLGALATIISCFLPWYGINSRVIDEWWNAFSSIGSVAGGFITGSSLIIIGVILAPVFVTGLDITKKFPWGKFQITTFLSAQNTFVALLFVPVYSQYALATAANSGIRFGLYSALISSLVASIASLFAVQRAESLRKKEEGVFSEETREHRALEEEVSEAYELQEQWSEPEKKKDEMFADTSEDETLVGRYQESETQQYGQAKDKKSYNLYQS